MSIQKTLEYFLGNLVTFDGGENESNWMAFGLPKGSIPDQYVSECEGGGKNLHIYKMGRVSGEQAEI